MKICDNCLTAAYDEGVIHEEAQRTVCNVHGDEIADHNCEAKEEDNDTFECDCRCNEVEA